MTAGANLYRCSILLAALVSGNVATASDRLPIENIVVTATKSPTSLDSATIPTQVIDRRDILQSSVTGVEEILNQIPGIFVRNNEQFRLGASTVRMQGADANKVAILLNGRRFRGGVDGVVDLRDIAVANIERIEIIRGPASSLYGSDAMGGVINIITRSGYDEPTVEMIGGGGNFGALLFSASHGYQVGGLSYFISGQHQESEIARELGAISDQFSGGAGDAKQSRSNAFVQLEQQVGNSHELSLVGDVTPVREGPQSERLDWTLSSDWKWEVSDATNFRLGASRYAFQRENDLEGFQEDVDYTDWTFDTLGSHSVLDPFDFAHTLSVGYVHRRSAIESKGVERLFGDGSTFTPPSTDESVYFNSPFVQDEIELSSSFSAVIGTSVDIHSLFSTEVNPRVATAWRPLPGLRLAVLFGRGYRAPDLLQLFDSDFNNVVGVDPNGTPQGYAIIGNPDLDPEVDYAWNIQLDYEPSNAFSLSLTLFRHDFRDLIATALCDEECLGEVDGDLPRLVFTNENVDEAITQGVELGLALRPLELVPEAASAHDITINLGYAFLDSENRSGRDDDGNQLPFRPPHRFLPTLTYSYSPLRSVLRISGEWEDRAYSDITNTSVVGSHWIWNFKLSVSLAAALERLNLVETDRYGDVEMFVQGDNVFDETFGVPGPMGRAVGRRSFLAGVRYEL